jgi:Zn-dependent protease
MPFAICYKLTAECLRSYQGESHLLFTPAAMISRAIVFLLALDVHEFAHAYVAHLMGDDTAKEQGRMTLNPFVNIYWPGYIAAILLGIGILGSAPVNPYRMRNRRLGMFLAVGAGAISNLLLAALFAIPFRFGLLQIGLSGMGEELFPTIDSLLFDMVFYNLLLFVLNLLPLHPLDGWTVMLAVLPPEWAIWWERNKQNSMYVFYGLIVLAFIWPRLAVMAPVLERLNLIDWLLYTPIGFFLQLLIGM